MNNVTSPWLMQAQAGQMSLVPQFKTARAPAAIADPQAAVNDPIPPMLKAPVIPGGDRPSVTQAGSLNQSLGQKPQGLRAYLPGAKDRNIDDDQLQGFKDAQAQATVAQEAELSGLSDYINNIAAKPADINWSPIAAYLDSKNGSHYMEAAKAMAPMTQDKKDAMIFDLKNKLLGGRATLAKENLAALQQQANSQMSREKQDELERYHDGMLASMAQRGAAMSGRNETAKDTQAQRMADRFDTNPIIKNGLDRYNQIGLDRHTLETTDVITPQIMDELSQGIATALAGGRAAGLGQSEKQELQNIQKDYARLKQYSGKPMNALSPENRKMLLGLFDRLQDGYGNIIAAQAERIGQGREFGFNPLGNQTRDQKIAEYRSYRAKSRGGGGGSDEVTITNGKETHVIPRSDLEAAKADGFREMK